MKRLLSGFRVFALGEGFSADSLWGLIGLAMMMPLPCLALVVDGPTTWSNQVLLNEDIRVIDGGVLRIEQGTIITVGSDVQGVNLGDSELIELILDGGELELRSAADQPVVFKGEGLEGRGETWAGIRLWSGIAALHQFEIYHASVGIRIDGNGLFEIANGLIEGGGERSAD